MRIVDLLIHLGRPRERFIAQHLPAPARIPPHERRQLREAQVRIAAKWQAFDDMIRDYDGQGQVFGHRR